jgi:hypothetical protein
MPVAILSHCSNRFGFYPCEYDTYRKLRRLNFLRLLSLRQDARYERWARKLPHNRILRKRGRVVYENGKTVPCPEPAKGMTKLFDGIEEEYKRARYPKQTIEAVQKLNLSVADIDTKLEEAEKWAWPVEKY